jgi:hypothetical protein
MDFRSNYRTIVVRLPPSLSNERYAPLVHAIFSLLDVAGIAGCHRYSRTAKQPTPS